MAHSPDALAADLAALGVRPGGVLMVHSSLSALGHVEGGAATVVAALTAALGSSGTLVMPAFRDSLSLPGLHRSLPDDVLAKAREVMPLHDEAAAPSQMGAIAEAFRQAEGVQRSPHPSTAVIARGPRAAEILETHPLPWATGPGSPFERLHETDAQQLLLGVGFNRLTLLHYAESRLPHGRRKTRVVPTSTGVTLAHDVGDDMDVHFPEIGRRVLAAGLAREGRIGDAAAILMDSRPVVAFAERYLADALVAP